MSKSTVNPKTLRSMPERREIISEAMTLVDIGFYDTVLARYDENDPVYLEERYPETFIVKLTSWCWILTEADLEEEE